MEHYATVQQVFTGGLVFARVGALTMTIPGIGETPTPVRVRLAFAFLLSLVVTPIVAPTLPQVPPTTGELIFPASEAYP